MQLVKNTLMENVIRGKHPVQVPRWLILHRGLKLNSQISAGKYKKKSNSLGPVDFSSGC